jgi:ABC-type nitrate/sulfonate/bicarbonate transport system substrate-binding protein
MIGWLLLAASAAYVWVKTRPTSSQVVTDPTTVRTAQAMLRSWLNAAGMTSVPAFTGDVPPAGSVMSSGLPNDPQTVAALQGFQIWSRQNLIEFQESPMGFAHPLRTDGVLDRATIGVLAAFTQAPRASLTAGFGGDDHREMT